MNYPGQVVDDVEQGVLVLDGLDGLEAVEEEQDDHHEEVDEAEDGPPVAPGGGTMANTNPQLWKKKKNK